MLTNVLSSIRCISTIIHKKRNPTNPIRSPKANTRKYVPSRPLTILYFANTKSWSLNTKLQGKEITAASTWGRMCQCFSRSSDSQVRSLLWLVIGQSLIKFLVLLSDPTLPIQSNLCSHSGRTPQSCPPPTCSWAHGRCSWSRSWCLESMSGGFKIVLPFHHWDPIPGCIVGSTGSRSLAFSTWQLSWRLQSSPGN